MRYTPVSAFRGLPTSAPCLWFDQNGLVSHSCLILSNDGKTLVVSAGQPAKQYSYDLTGDGTACIPVTPIAP